MRVNSENECELQSKRGAVQKLKEYGMVTIGLLIF